MNDSAIKNFAINARLQLLEEVGNQMTRWAIADAGAVPATADVLNGQPLSAQQRQQRVQLLERCRHVGAEQLREQAAYTWFNRFAAIRFMELHDYLPCRLRFFSAADGTFAPRVMDEALRADIVGADRARVAELVQAGDREALFRYLLLAQCNELADALPAVFERVGAGMELLLPEHLLRQGSVIEQMVTAMPEADWQKVEILGWLYQYYNTELKDDFFKSKRKANAKDIGPATQLFTPEWIVRYMVENSLGRLWMLNFPDSQLAAGWDYYIAPDAQHEDFIRITGPEDISLCDPACGSGHILVYAFELLFSMYIERGYREREIPQLILEKNLAGMEIDPRAAQIAHLALAMCAREHDRRFFTRDVQANICVVRPTKFDRDEAGNVTELPDDAQVMAHPQLIDALEHLDEIGSLFNPSELELAALRADAKRFKQEAEAGDMFKANIAEKLQGALEVCEALARKFDCVVANPPYMGSSSFSPYMSKWIKKHYPDEKAELCCCFLQRGIRSFSHLNGYVAMITMQSWLFSDTYKAMREHLLRENPIASMVHIGSRGFDSISGEIVSTAAFTIAVGCGSLPGRFYRLTEYAGELNKSNALKRILSDIDSPDYFMASYNSFARIPSCPIVYWASEGLLAAFNNIAPLSQVQNPLQGLATTDNERFLRNWWEASLSSCMLTASSREEAADSKKKWFPHCKGGSFRKWVGNKELLINWENDGAELYSLIAARYGSPSKRIVNANSYFHPGVTYSDVSTGVFSCRVSNYAVFDVTGPMIPCQGETRDAILGCLNSSSFQSFLYATSPGLHYKNGVLASLPTPIRAIKGTEKAVSAVHQAISISAADYDSFETSWDFKHHPLL